MVEMEQKIAEVKAGILRFLAYCELSGELADVIDDDGLRAELSEGRSVEELVGEFVEMQAQYLLPVILKPLFGRGARAERKAEKFLFCDAARATLMRDCSEYNALWDALTQEQRDLFVAAQNAPKTAKLTDKLWFNVLTLFIPKLVVIVRKKSRPTDESIVRSDFFVQWMRLALCARGVKVPMTFAPLSAWSEDEEQEPSAVVDKTAEHPTDQE